MRRARAVIRPSKVYSFDTNNTVPSTLSKGYCKTPDSYARCKTKSRASAHDRTLPAISSEASLVTAACCNFVAINTQDACCRGPSGKRLDDACRALPMGYFAHQQTNIFFVNDMRVLLNMSPVSPTISKLTHSPRYRLRSTGGCRSVPMRRRYVGTCRCFVWAPFGIRSTCFCLTFATLCGISHLGL